MRDNVFFDSECRIEQMIYVPSLAADEDSFPDVFEEEFIDGFPTREDAPLFVQLPILKRFFGTDDSLNPMDVAEALVAAATPGFLFQAATPCREYGNSGYYYSSWGNYHTEWLYAPAVTAMEAACVEWAEQRHAEARVKAKLSAETVQP